MLRCMLSKRSTDSVSTSSSSQPSKSARISTGRGTTAEELDRFVEGLAEVVQRLRRLSGGRR